MSNPLDEIDLGILRLLQEDARLSNKQLAYRLHRSPNPIHVRVRRLQEEGYIKRYTAILNHKKIGRGLIAFTQVHIDKHTQENLKAFQLEVVKIPEVMECFHLTGPFDFLLRIAVKDIDAYNEVLMKKLSNLPHVSNMQSLFVMSEAKVETAYTLGI